MTSQAIPGIVNTLFWLYCGFNFSESKIIVIHKAVYILRNLQLETVISNRYDRDLDLSGPHE